MRKPKSPLSGWIVEQRKERGWKSEELARRLDVSESTVRSWEAGRGVSPDNLDRMERLFGVQAPGVGGDGQGDVAAAIREQNDLIREANKLRRQEVDAILQNAKATEGLVKALGARMDRLEQDRQRDFRNLVEGISDTMIHAFQVALAGAKDGSGSDESTHGVHQGSGQ